MVDILRTDLVLGEAGGPGSSRLLVGGLDATDATPIVQIIHGTAAIDIPSTAVGAVTSASAAVTGLTTAFNVLVLPQAWSANTPVNIQGAIGIAGGIQVSATNAGSATFDPASQTFQYWAWR